MKLRRPTQAANLTRLKEIGTELAEAHSKELDEFVRLLTATKSK